MNGKLLLLGLVLSISLATRASAYDTWDWAPMPGPGCTDAYANFHVGEGAFEEHWWVTDGSDSFYFTYYKSCGTSGGCDESSGIELLISSGYWVDSHDVGGANDLYHTGMGCR